MNLVDPVQRRLLLRRGLGLAAALAVPARLRAEDHSAHARAAAAPSVRRSSVRLEPAAVQVTREDGRSLSLQQLLADKRPVMLNFIYTSCTAICPVTSQVFREVRERMGAQREQLLAVSVSIDPEYDNVRRLAEYASRFDGGSASWRFLTSSLKDSVAIQKSFDAYQGDKMNHLPITFVRPAAGAQWTRFDGFASPAVLVQELKPLLEVAPGVRPARPSPS